MLLEDRYPIGTRSMVASASRVARWSSRIRSRLTGASFVFSVRREVSKTAIPSNPNCSKAFRSWGMTSTGDKTALVEGPQQ